METDEIKNRLDISELIEEIKTKDIRPIIFSNSNETGIASYLKGNDGFLNGYHGELKIWGYSNEYDYKYVSENNFAKFISDKTGENEDIALWRLAAATFWDNINHHDNKVIEILNSLITGSPLDFLEWDVCDLLLMDLKNHSKWGKFLNQDIQDENWQKIIELTRLCYISSTEFKDTEVENTVFNYYCLFLDKVAKIESKSLVRTYHSTLSKEEKTNEYIDFFLESRNFEGNYYFTSSFIFRLIFNYEPNAESELRILNSGIRSIIDRYSEKNKNALEYILCFLKFHTNSKNAGKKFIIHDLNISTNTKEEKATIDFIHYLETIASEKWNINIDTYCLRAVEVAKETGKLLEVFIYWIIRAFSNEITTELVAIFSECITNNSIKRLEYFSQNNEKDKFSSTGCVIDKIFRNLGIRPNNPSPIEMRDLYLPFEPISGSTWLNDFNIEHLLYNSSLKAESNFAQEYNNTIYEREDDLIRDLFDDNLKSSFEIAIKELNLYNINKKDFWSLSWTKLRLVEENTKGPDIALKVKVNVSMKVQFEKYIFIQVKALSKQKSKFKSAWTINKKQLNDITKLSDSSFYLLLTPSILSNHQRVIPASIIKGMLEANNKEVTLTDNIASIGAHSLSQFLIYDVLSGWQGTQNKDIINWLENRKGMKTRFILEIELRKEKNKEQSFN
jgi:hypothetical protein